MKDVVIAERRLLYTRGDSDLRPAIIRIYLPQPVDPSSVRFSVSPGTAVCLLDFGDLPPGRVSVYGMDSLQALTLAVNIDPYIRGMERTDGCRFYWDSGEPYFD
jgi:hypothetical protein